MPALTVLGVRAAGLLGGSVIIEMIFGMPGIGRMTIDAVFRQDFTALQAIVLLAAVLVVLVNLFVDIVYALLNPKVRVG
jgi:peptide/nickel transport system permease protein